MLQTDPDNVKIKILKIFFDIIQANKVLYVNF